MTVVQVDIQLTEGLKLMPPDERSVPEDCLQLPPASGSVGIGSVGCSTITRAPHDDSCG
jgi:hypothetical protein